MMSSRFVMESPQGLSPRAREFLVARATRVSVDLGPTGETLRSEMLRVLGVADEDFLRTVESVQARYAGLSYPSGLFDSVVRFAPSFDPDEDDDEWEILYAVDTGGVTGASLTKSGEVEIGIDGAGFIEFDSLDQVIECDALFAAAAAHSTAKTVYLDGRLADPAAVVAMVGPVELVPAASGRRTWWFTGPDTYVFYSTIWHDLGLGLPPFVKVWSDTPAINHRMEERSRSAYWQQVID